MFYRASTVAMAVRNKICTFAVRLFGDTLRVSGAGVLIVVHLAVRHG